MHVDLGTELRTARSCNTTGFEILHSSGRLVSIVNAAENLHLAGPIYEGKIQPGDITFMWRCLHHFTVPKGDDVSAEYIRLSGPDPRVREFDDCII
jgi:hypothetical protein